MENNPVWIQVPVPSSLVVSQFKIERCVGFLWLCSMCRTLITTNISQGVGGYDLPHSKYNQYKPGIRGIWWILLVVSYVQGGRGYSNDCSSSCQYFTALKCFLLHIIIEKRLIYPLISYPRFLSKYTQIQCSHQNFHWGLFDFTNKNPRIYNEYF